MVKSAYSASAAQGSSGLDRSFAVKNIMKTFGETKMGSGLDGDIIHFLTLMVVLWLSRRMPLFVGVNVSVFRGDGASCLLLTLQ